VLFERSFHPVLVYAKNSPAQQLYETFIGKHPYVGPIELRKIAVGKSECSKEELKFIPYSQILKTASVWAVWIAAIGNFTAVNMMFLFAPNYLNKVLHFQIQHTGFSASLPPLLQFLIKLLAGFTSDKVCLLRAVVQFIYILRSASYPRLTNFAYTTQLRLLARLAF
jgi:sugar phosphate permease